ncbi:MAG: CelD/BcsL family acetyltransferase involved in cellulose biosynthesis [Verrucomicrobiales bacterium]|jgi:CelD/BcsL family acetyltransferase involved in cellulose biosynthesis
MHGNTQSLAAPQAATAPISRAAKPSTAVSQPEKLTCRLIQSTDDLDEVAEDWISLATSSKGSPFQSFAWNRAWLQHFSEDYDELAVFSFSRGKEPAAIFPFYRQGRCLRLAGDTDGDLQDAIATDESAAQEGLREVMRWARRNGCHLKMLSISERGRLHGAARSIGLLRNRAFRFQRGYSTCLYADLPESADAWIQQLPRKVRGDMRRHVNKLDRQHPEAKVAIHRAGEVPEGLVERVAAFHDEHFRKDGVSLMRDPRVVDLIADAARCPDSGLRVSTLTDGDKLMAVDIGFTFNRTYHGFLTSFDPAYRKISPGTCLLMKRLDWFIKDDGVRCLDFLLGAERYKSQFAQESYEVGATYLFPWSISNAFRWASVAAKRVIKILAKKTLAESAVYKMAKTAIKGKPAGAPEKTVEVTAEKSPFQVLKPEGDLAAQKEAERARVAKIAGGAAEKEAGKRSAA